jgi:threonine dehydrogenase-like Zn-dependent dehydrogenase
VACDQRRARRGAFPTRKFLNPRDAIVRHHSTAICGSDLHLLNGFIPTMQAGDILGHEFMGEVVEVGLGTRSSRSASGWSFRSLSRVGTAFLHARALVAL